MHARLVLARAVTIAIRYTSIRRQFHSKDSPIPTKGEVQQEIPVLDYSTVQIRLFPLLASTFALHYSGLAMKKLFDQTRSAVEKNEFSGLIELHTMSSGLKSLCTDTAADGIEICRRAMGGHGFGGYSGLVQLNADYLSKPTVEGDNWMITQQVSRYLMKMATAIAKDNARGGTGPAAAMLRNYRSRPDRTPDLNVLDNIHDMVTAFEHRTAYLVRDLTIY